jgi:hypothetical protein
MAITQFEINWIRSSLKIAQKQAKEIGTDADIKQIDYTLRLLSMVEDKITPEHPGDNFLREIAKYGSD